MPDDAGVSPKAPATSPQPECDDDTRICTITGVSSENAVYGAYDVRIHASIASATDVGSAADETSVEFQITIYRHPVCENVDPLINSIVPVTQA